MILPGIIQGRGGEARVHYGGEQFRTGLNDLLNQEGLYLNLSFPKQSDQTANKTQSEIMTQFHLEETDVKPSFSTQPNPAATESPTDLDRSLHIA